MLLPMGCPVLLPSKHDCSLCDLHQYPGTFGHRGIPSRWWDQSLPPSPRVPALFCIGTNPGWQENEKGLCFVGRPGDMLQKVYLEGATLPSRCTIYFGSVARCYTPAQTPPKLKHFKTCEPFLWDDLARIPPTCSTLYLLALGADASNSVLRLYGSRKKHALSTAMSLLQGARHESPVPSTTFATFHPNAVGRNPNLVHSVQSHLQLLSDAIDGVIQPRAFPQIIPTRSPR